VIPIPGVVQRPQLALPNGLNGFGCGDCELQISKKPSVLLAKNQHEDQRNATLTRGCRVRDRTAVLELEPDAKTGSSRLPANPNPECPLSARLSEKKARQAKSVPHPQKDRPKNLPAGLRLRGSSRESVCLCVLSVGSFSLCALF